MTRETVISLAIIAGLFLGGFGVKAISNINAEIIRMEKME